MPHYFCIVQSRLSVLLKLLHLVVQNLNLSKIYKIIANGVFGRELANDLGAAGRPACLNCLIRRPGSAWPAALCL